MESEVKTTRPGALLEREGKRGHPFPQTRCFGSSCWGLILSGASGSGFWGCAGDAQLRALRAVGTH